MDFKVTELTPNYKIVWAITNSYLPWLKDKTEWTNTSVIFELYGDDNLTTINFTHLGLVPQVECYETCVAGWAKYIPGSLQKLLNDGVGQPA